eukprot:27865-Eustigmatos_ZCMA.PRE.1
MAFVVVGLYMSSTGKPSTVKHLCSTESRAKEVYRMLLKKKYPDFTSLGVDVYRGDIAVVDVNNLPMVNTINW